MSRLTTSLLTACLLWVLATAGAGAADLDLRVEFDKEKKPVLVGTLAAEAPADATNLDIAIRLVDVSDSKEVWKGPLRFEVAGKAAPWTARLPLAQATDVKKQYRVEVELRGQLGLQHEETLWFGSPDAKVRAYSLRRLGRFPQETLQLGVGLAGFPNVEITEAPLNWELRDGDDNALSSREEKLAITATGGWQRFDVTPDASASVGPYRLEFSVEQELLGLFLSSSLAFGYANALVPVTSFETDQPLWFASTEELPREGYMSQYYSPQFRISRFADYPGLALDLAEKHDGRGALRIDYQDGREARVFFTKLALPGNATMAHFWVKGNGTDAVLRLVWSDNINHFITAWTRNGLFQHRQICKLNFEGWKRVSVPVFGDGLAVPGRKGSTEEVDAPMHLVALAVDAGRLGRDQVAQPRSVWIDDLVVETQAQMTERLSLELAVSDSFGRLLPETQIHAAVGNGAGKDLAKVMVTLTARDAAGQTVYTTRQELAIADGRTQSVSFALADLAAKQPAGPVSVEIAAFDPTIPGLRATHTRQLKRPEEGGMYLDFEDAEIYSGYLPDNTRRGEGAGVVEAGGVDGSQALALTVKPKPEGDPEERKKREYVPPHNTVLLHPTLPGLVSTVTLQIQGGDQPVTLQPIFVDSGSTGVWNRNANHFWPEPILVDWQGWREVTIETPAIPPQWGGTEVTYLFEPCYPLNLVFDATLVGEQTADRKPTVIRLDNIRVSSHMAPSERLQAAVRWPTEQRLHAPGSPLALTLRNYGVARELDFGVTLTSLQGVVVQDGRQKATVPAGALQRLTLVDKLEPGIYELRVTDLLAAPIVDYIQVLDVTAFFGADPLATARDMVELRRRLGQMQEKAYLDFDNTEPVPNLFHYNFFEQVCKQVGANGAYTLMPVFGFSADWAGPESQESIADGSYSRDFPNLLQVPVRLEDWSQYVRACMREYHGRFDTWIFWENPDLQDAPQGIPAARYRDLLSVVYKWAKLYDPDGTVVAGGFNFDRVLDYLEQIESPETLPFDEIAVQMNLAELSPEQAEMETFLDELGALLHLRETGRRIRTAELDWGIGDYVSPLQQAAYHVRAGLILDSRGAQQHTYSMINGGNAFEGYGIFHRDGYGSSPDIQTFKPWHIPKPSYFALIYLRRFLADWDFVQRVELPDRQLTDNRAFLYRNAAGRLALALWRVRDGQRRYVWPEGWQAIPAEDAFGFPLRDRGALVCGTLPSIYYLPEGAEAGSVATTLRHLRAEDGSYPVILDLPLTDAHGRERQRYQAGGQLGDASFGGTIPGGRVVRETYTTGITDESFQFEAPSAGDILLRRRWYFDGQGQTLTVTLNDAAPLTWDLAAPQDKTAGPRESTLLLRGCVAGVNRIVLRADTSGAVAGYRLEPVTTDHVPLSRWGMLASRQTVGQVETYQSAVGTPLRIGETTYDSGIGAHAVSYIEYPLAGQFERFEVTVGIDGSTEGRGSVLFRVFADGKEVANSGPVNGFTKPQTLTVDELSGVKRLILSVTDGDDGTKNDLADWVDGRLIPAAAPAP